MSLPLAEATWARDGVRYLQPEIVLLFKARHLRDKDRADFAAPCRCWRSRGGRGCAGRCGGCTPGTSGSTRSAEGCT